MPREPVRQALCIALLGAESTGKTALAQALSEQISQLTGLATTWVPEHLRLWCDQQGRTPQAHEQRAIAEQQQQLITAAAASHAVVVCDTTPLMTAVYSQMVFNDHSLNAWALQLQRGHAITLLTALDLPWQADGLQRDGAQVQLPVDNLLRGMLMAHGLPWALVGGRGEARLASALDAVTPMLQGLTPPRRGLFTRLAEQDDRLALAGRGWVCGDCDQPDCEHLLR